eukprot:jgi/Botrbrau1/12224/Bobra.0197s0017.1
MMCFEVLRLPSKGGEGVTVNLILPPARLHVSFPLTLKPNSAPPLLVCGVFIHIFSFMLPGLLALVKLSPAPHTLSVIFNACTSPTRTCTTKVHKAQAKCWACSRVNY